MYLVVCLVVLLVGGAVVGTFLKHGYQIRRLQAQVQRHGEALHTQNLLESRDLS